MLYNIWRWLQLWLPYGLVLHLYKTNKSLPCNIALKNGRKLKAIMITTDYGVLFSQEKYVENRLQLLKKKQETAFKLNNELLQEINSLTMEQREEMYNREQNNGV